MSPIEVDDPARSPEAAGRAPSRRSERSDVAARHVGCLIDEFPTLVALPRAAHTWALRPLTGEGESEHWGEARRTATVRAATDE